ncbi:MAG: hypothetical protein AB7T22_04675 [Calditrichaceae bacterium]
MNTNSEINTKFRYAFYDMVEPIKLTDPLSAFLGATNESEPFIYHYKDIVKLSGHSCPTVAGAYKTTQLALKSLYDNTTPVRGQIKVKIAGGPEQLVNGPASQVISFITGAAPVTGFKGIKGKFNRYNMLTFDEDIQPEKDVSSDILFERTDSLKKVRVLYRPQFIYQNPEIGRLLPLMLSGMATETDKTLFGDLWQERVRIVLLETPPEAFEIITY